MKESYKIKKLSHMQVFLTFETSAHTKHTKP